MELVQTHCMKWGIAMFALTLWQARDKKFCGAFSKATSPVVLPRRPLQMFLTRYLRYVTI